MKKRDKKYFQVQFMYVLSKEIREKEKTFVHTDFSSSPHAEFLWDLTVDVHNCLKAVGYNCRHAYAYPDGSMYMYVRTGSTANIHNLKEHIMKTLKEWNFHNVIPDIKITIEEPFADLCIDSKEKRTITSLFFHSSNTVGLAIRRNHEQ